MITMPASTNRLWMVGSTATVLIMSAATRNSKPSKIERPRLDRKVATSVDRGDVSRAIATRNTVKAPKAPITMMAVPAISMALVDKWIQ